MSSLLIKSSIIIVAVSLVGRLLGFLRNVFLANTFGGMESDAYVMAVTIPLTLFLIIPGAVNSVLIPTMKGLIGDEHHAKRNDLFEKTLTVSSILFLLLTIAGILWADPIISVMAHGFPEAKRRLTVELLQIMMPSTFFIGLVAVFSSVLNAHNEFFESSLGIVINSGIVILSFYTLVPLWGIKGLAWGTMIGFAAFAVYLIIPMKRRKYRLRWNVRITGDEHILSMGRRFTPIMGGMVISQLYPILERFFASSLGDQKLTVLYLANSIVQLPIAIFAGSLAVPLFPLLSEYVKKNRMDLMKDTMAKGILYQYHLLLPCTLGLILLPKEVVRIFYSHSATFNEQSVGITAWALIFYSVGILGWAGRDMLTRAFYAVENTKTPVIVGGLSLVVYIALGWTLIPLLDHGGIALAFSLASFFNLGLQAIFLRKQIGRLFTKSFYISILKGIGSVAAMSAVLWVLKGPSHMLGLFQLPVLVTIAVVVYFGLLILLKEETVYVLAAKLLTRFKLSKSH
jgi:putative peptidoglycan lipid II flippase